MLMKGVISLEFSILIFCLCCIQLNSAQLAIEKLSDISKERLKHEKELQCYDCSSEFDSRCGDPFDSYTVGIINCSDKKPPENLLNPDLRNGPYPKPTVCRKIVQKVQGHKRVIRECGYIRDERDDKPCILRTGTKDVEMEYCSCTTSLCNSGENLHSFAVLVLSFSTLGLFLLLA